MSTTSRPFYNSGEGKKRGFLNPNVQCVTLDFGFLQKNIMFHGHLLTYIPITISAIFNLCKSKPSINLKIRYKYQTHSMYKSINH